jgi:hypothetical protein
VREEDLDWDIYHIVAMNREIAPAELVQRFGQPGDVIEDSVARLQRRHLICRTENGLRVLSVAESMARCQLQQCDDHRIYLENGVIKVHPDSGGDPR